jgi:hypothetical protein|tara:strand:+ start:884 stop:1000 length:117 start_codon:yes stop_codon:yes gene_type:complete
MTLVNVVTEEQVVEGVDVSLVVVGWTLPNIEESHKIDV